MKFKQLLEYFHLKKRENISWKDRYEVGRGTYGKPIIRHWGEPSTLRVGCFCSIASRGEAVTIFLGGNHRTDWITTYPFYGLWESAKHLEGHSVSRGDVVIGNDVWIGEGAVILSGVSLGNGAVVGASSVVTRDVPSYTIVAGNPAKAIRQRFSTEDIALLESLQWWHWKDEKIADAMPLLLSGDISALYDFSIKYDM